MADSVSLSPKRISYVEIVSFSLTMGIAPRESSVSKVLRALIRFSPLIKVFLVIRICDAI